jgi:menaquinone-specific isochorismate synthase
VRPADPSSLRALTVPLACNDVKPLVSATPQDGDLRYLSPRSLSFAGSGTAAILELPSGLAEAAELDEVLNWLRAVPHHDEVRRSGSAVSAHGALAFEPTTPARLIVPAVCAAHDAQGHAWATVVTAADEPLDETRVRVLVRQAASAARGQVRSGTERAGMPPGADAGAPSVLLRPPPAAHTRSVAAAVAAITNGLLQKVVLARSIEVHLAAPPDVGDVLERLRTQEPTCTVFAHPVPGGWFVGASPELLLSRCGNRVRCHPLAGTVGLTATAADDRAIESFLDSKKELAEHELVVEAIAAALAPYCDRLRVPTAPSLVRLRSVAHLGTLVVGHLRDRGQPSHALALLAAIHPTPAVGGVPRREALALIAKLEPGPRGNWAGPVGWVDARGDGEWMLGIRSATLSTAGAVLWAGSGIVSGSLPEAELAETTIKLVPVLEAVAPGAGERLRRTT